MIELKLATAGDGLWADPAKLNDFFSEALREITSLEETGDEVEDQNPNAILFAANDDGQFDLDHSPRARGLPTSSDPLFVELVHTVSEVVAQAADNSSALLRERAERYQSALLHLHEASGPAVLVVRGESLRILKQAYDNYADSLDLPPLTEQARMRLDELVAQHNVLVGLYGGLAFVDKLVQPSLDYDLLSSTDLRQIIEEARSQRLLTSDAESALREVAEQASSPSGAKRNIVRASESGKNLIRGAVRELIKYKRALGVAAVGMPPALYAIGRWALANEAILTGYFQGNPGMHQALIHIFEWLHTLPLT
jgi:hypothetical protein